MTMIRHARRPFSKRWQTSVRNTMGRFSSWDMNDCIVLLRPVILARAALFVVIGDEPLESSHKNRHAFAS